MVEKTSENMEINYQTLEHYFSKSCIKCYLCPWDLGCNGNIKNDKIIKDGEKGTSKQCKMEKKTVWVICNRNEEYCISWSQS